MHDVFRGIVTDRSNPRALVHVEFPSWEEGVKTLCGYRGEEWKPSHMPPDCPMCLTVIRYCKVRWMPKVKIFQRFLEPLAPGEIACAECGRKIETKRHKWETWVVPEKPKAPGRMEVCRQCAKRFRHAGADVYRDGKKQVSIRNIFR